MVDIATLGLKIDSTQVAAATTALDKLGATGEAAAARTERAWQRTTQQTRNAFQTGGAFGSGAQQQIMQQMIRDARAVQDLLRFQNAASSASNATRAMAALRQGLVGVALQATATSGPVGRLAQAALLFGPGANAIIGVAAAVGILALAYQGLTASTRENQRAQDELLKSLDAIGKHAQVTAARIRIAAIEAAQAASKASELRFSITPVGLLDRLLGGDVGGFTEASEAAKRQIATLQTLIAQLHREMAKPAEREAAQAAKRHAEELRRAAEQREQMVVSAERELELFGVSVERAAQLRGIWAGLNAQQQERLVAAAAELRIRQVQAELAERERAARQALADRAVPGMRGLTASSTISVATELSPAIVDQLARDLERVKREIDRVLGDPDLFAPMARGFAQSFDHMLDQSVSRFRNFTAEILRVWAQVATDLAAKRALEQATKLGVSAPVAGALAGTAGAAVGAIGALVAGLFNLGDAARVARERARELARSLDAFRASTTPGDLDDQILAIRAQAEQLRQDVGTSSRRQYFLLEIGFLEEKRIAQLEAEAAALKQATIEDLQVRLLRARGGDQGADDWAFRLQQERELAEAVRNGADETHKRLIEEVHLAEAQKRAADRIRETISGLTATIATLRGFTDSLRLNTQLTALSPVQQLAEARRQYEQVLSAAQGGDQAAAGRLPDVARAFLEASRAVNASGGRYQVDFTRVLRETEAVAQMFEAQRSAQEQQLEALRYIGDQLGDLPDWPIEPIAEATAAAAETLKDVVAELQTVVRVLVAHGKLTESGLDAVAHASLKTARMLEGARL